ncbi:MAG: hypothetical protein QOH86_165 [Sphingomonadales bacterium]|jgi:hypothetical protein|nr:hypothetical protein [Sphingomonadales bacterium]
MKKTRFAALAAVALVAAPVAAANWAVIGPSQSVTVAGSTMTVTPRTAWNKATHKIGPKAEAWTQDGFTLNELDFMAGIAPGEALVKERNKKDKPLPRFSASMTPPDIVQMFEATDRILLNTSLFEVDKVEPAKLGSRDGFRFEYHYVVQDDEVRRKGEARAAVVGGKLYMIKYSAPAIHYYDTGIDEVRAIMDGARL